MLCMHAALTPERAAGADAAGDELLQKLLPVDAAIDAVVHQCPLAVAVVASLLCWRPITEEGLMEACTVGRGWKWQECTPSRHIQSAESAAAVGQIRQHQASHHHPLFSF